MSEWTKKVVKMKERIHAVIDVVKDFDEPYRTKAFEVILSKSMEGIPFKKSVRGAERRGEILPVKDKIEEFAGATNLSVDQLENVFEFDEKDFRFIAPLTGSVPQRQVNFAHCVLTGLEQVYGRKSIKATELAKMMDDYGLKTKNLSRSLQNQPDIFRRTGKKKETRYKLTDVGKRSAIELIHTLATSSVPT